MFLQNAGEPPAPGRPPGVPVTHAVPRVIGSGWRARVCARTAGSAARREHSTTVWGASSRLT